MIRRGCAIKVGCCVDDDGRVVAREARVATRVGLGIRGGVSGTLKKHTNGL